MTTRDLAAILAPDDPRKRLRLRQGVVTATATVPNRVTLTIGGSTDTVTDVRYLASYSPTIADTVWLLQNGTDLLVLGKLA